MKKFYLSIMVQLCITQIWAYTCKVNGICYNLNWDTHTATVTYSGYPYNNDYTGHYGGGLKGANIQIPSTITYNDAEYTVTAIGDKAFYDCESSVQMSSITLPSTVTCIGSQAFWKCTNLTSFTIPSCVTSIGDCAFYGCWNLTTVTVEREIPLSITSDTFSNSTNATLYVPYGCKAAYAAANYWKEFKEIIEVARTGDPTDNTLSLSDIDEYKGKQVVLPIALTNKHQITGLQFDLYLPDGVTVATKTNGKMKIETTSRMDGNYSISSNTMDGFVRVLGYSADGDAFTGSEGDILNITLDIANTIADGDYTIRIADIVLSDVNSTEYHPNDAGAILTVKSYTLGDVDNSGAININDVVCIINHILNKTTGTFIEDAADVDGNGSININDVVTLINHYILHRTSARSQMPKAQPTDAADIISSNYVHLADIDIKPGETKTIQMLMTNANTVAGIQGNIKLPNGLSFVKKNNGRVDAANVNSRAEDFTLSCAVQDDGSLTFAQYSADGFTFEGNEGAVFTFKIKADENATDGTYSVNLSDVVLSINGVGYDIPNRTSSLTITGATAIETIELQDQFDVYTLDGIKVRSKVTTTKDLPCGVYIVNGRKVVIK